MIKEAVSPGEAFVGLRHARDVGRAYSGQVSAYAGRLARRLGSDLKSVYKGTVSRLSNPGGVTPPKPSNLPAVPKPTPNVAGAANKAGVFSKIPKPLRMGALGVAGVGAVALGAGLSRNRQKEKLAYVLKTATTKAAYSKDHRLLDRMEKGKRRDLGWAGGGLAGMTLGGAAGLTLNALAKKKGLSASSKLTERGIRKVIKRQEKTASIRASILSKIEDHM